MKHKLLITIQTLAICASIAVVAPFAQAWTGPSAAFPNGNTDAPVNTGSVDQVKSGNLGTLQSFFAHLGVFGARGVFGCPDSNPICLWIPSLPVGSLVAGVFDASANLINGVHIDPSGNITLGKYGINTTFSNGLKVDTNGNPESLNAPFSVDTSSLSGANGSNVLNLVPATNTGTGWADQATVISNASTLAFWDYGSGTNHNKRMNLKAFNLDLDGVIRVGAQSGYPAPSAGAVLTSTDTNGDAQWGQVNQGSLYGGAYVVRVTGNPYGTNASCNTGDILIGGGGHCYGSSSPINIINAGTPRYPVSSSEPGPGPANDGTYNLSQFNYWHVDCHAHADGATAYAICMPANSTQVVTSIKVPTPPTCQDTAATNYGQVGACTYGPLTGVHLVASVATTCGPEYYHAVAAGGTPPIVYTTTITSYTGGHYGSTAGTGNVTVMDMPYSYTGSTPTVTVKTTARDANGATVTSTQTLYAMRAGNGC